MSGSHTAVADPSKDDSCGKCDVDLTGMQLNQTLTQVASAICLPALDPTLGTDLVSGQWLPLRDLAHPGS
eukprot:3811242-Rhodomonas_salina.5